MKFLEDAVNANKRCFNGCFPDLITRYQIGKKAQKKTKVVTDLQKNGSNFNNMPISNPAALSGILPMSSTNFVSYDTTKLAMMNVMEALREENINFIGIHGMGGVGKTTLVKEIGRKAKEEKLFDEVVMIVVSQTFGLKKIQGQIAEYLGLKLTEETASIRAGRLYARLKGVNKILIILDDVWTGLDVAAIGIPMGADHRGCKIVFTTRREQIFNAMGMGSQTTKIVHLGVLSEQESWDLLRRNAGDAIESSPMLKAVAKQVADECRGLPVAIVTVGRAIRDKDLEEWNEAVQELKKSVPSNIEGVDEQVYRCLKLSYDYLRDEEAKSCFLLCSLFPEDHNILIETLVRYAVGLEIFKRVDSIQEARHRAKLVINNLKAACLLMASDKENCIKMHDVVRDVAISIGSNKYLVRAGVNLKDWPKKEILDHHTGISLMHNDICEIGNVSERLEILLLQQSTWLNWKPSSRMKALKVLDLSDCRRSGPLEYISLSFGYLKCLQTLVLERKYFVDTSALGEIKTLEVLSFRGSLFSDSPIAIRQLTNLRLLDMTGCELQIWISGGLFERHTDNRVILEANMISSLSQLEELYLAYIIWEFVNELKSLPRLTVLTIDLDDKCVASLDEDFVFPDLEVFIIRRGARAVDAPNYLELGEPSTRSGRSTRWWRKCVKRLLKRTNHLCLSRFRETTNIIPNLLLYDGEFAGGLNLLETLLVEGCQEFEYLINNTEEEECGGILEQDHQQVLSNLKSLELDKLHSFKGICNDDVLPSTEVSLSKLQTLKITNCHKLSKVILPLNLLQRLQELESLTIWSCPAVEQVFDFEVELKLELGEDHQRRRHDHHHHLPLLSSLTELELSGLPRLMHIWKCPPSQLVLHLHNLRFVTICRCDRLKNLFHPCIARSFQRLENLKVESCKGLEEIVAKENEGLVDKMVFNSLTTLKLVRLSNLNGFCMGSFSFEWPSLEELILKDCPKMKTFTAAATSSEIQSTPILKLIKVDDVEIKLKGENLNTVLQNRFKAKETSTSSTAMESRK